MRSTWNLAKIDENLHVFWEFDFGGILGGFWEGFGKPASSIFACFSMFFRSIFQATLWKAKKSKKIAQQENVGRFLGRPGGMRVLRGREKERGGEGQRCRRYRKVLGYSQDEALIMKLKFRSSTPCTTYGGRRNAPRIPPSPFGSLEDCR